MSKDWAALSTWIPTSISTSALCFRSSLRTDAARSQSWYGTYRSWYRNRHGSQPPPPTTSLRLLPLALDPWLLALDWSIPPIKFALRRCPSASPQIKDRIVALLTNLYAALAQLVRRVQKDAGAEGRGSDENDYDEDEGEFDAVLEEAFSGGRNRQKPPQSSGRRRRRQPDGRSDVEPPIPTSRPPPPPPPPPPGFEGGEDSQYPGGRRGGSRY